MNNSVKLVINGNGSHLAPWHAKLGFTKICPIATTHSLTADGGIVPAMDVLILEASTFHDDSGHCLISKFRSSP